VQVNQVRPRLRDHAAQAQRERGVELAAHRHRHDLGTVPGRAGNLASRRAGQHILDAAPGQSVENVQDLSRSAVEVTPGFDVQDFHAAASASLASLTTRPDVMSRRQVKAPLQVGVRLHGEHSRPSQITRASGRQVSR
jgi:hypothetical protein